MLCIIQLDTVRPNAGAGWIHCIHTRMLCMSRGNEGGFTHTMGNSLNCCWLSRCGRAPFRVTHREICCVCLTDCSVPSYHWVYERTKRVRARVKTPYWSSVGFNILTTSWKGRTAVLNVCWPGFGTRFHALCSDALANIQAVKPNSDHMTSLLRRLQAACYCQCFY